MAPQRRSVGDIDVLIDELAGAVQSAGERFVLGIAGPPGAGKSTLADRIADRACRALPVCVAPMDGFHRSNEELETAGLLPFKGIPVTFDPEQFVMHLAALRTHPARPVSWPTYDRIRQSVVPGGTLIEPDRMLIVVEGNYLLLDEPPWDGVQPLLDAVWYLDVPETVLVPRLQQRHERNRSRDAAAAKVTSTDVPNARLVAATMHRADVILHHT